MARIFASYLHNVSAIRSAHRFWGPAWGNAQRHCRPGEIADAIDQLLGASVPELAEPSVARTETGETIQLDPGLDLDDAS